MEIRRITALTLILLSIPHRPMSVSSTTGSLDRDPRTLEYMELNCCVGDMLRFDSCTGSYLDEVEFISTTWLEGCRVFYKPRNRSSRKGDGSFLGAGRHMKLVASPLLDPEDIDALSRGYEARKNFVERAILRQMGEESLNSLTEASRLRLDCLAWLIADGRA